MLNGLSDKALLFLSQHIRIHCAAMPSYYTLLAHSVLCMCVKRSHDCLSLGSFINPLNFASILFVYFMVFSLVSHPSTLHS